MRIPHTFIILPRLNCAPCRWKWGSGDITGIVDEVVTEGQAQVESNKVRSFLLKGLPIRRWFNANVCLFD